MFLALGPLTHMIPFPNIMIDQPFLGARNYLMQQTPLTLTIEDDLISLRCQRNEFPCTAVANLAHDTMILD